MILQIVLMLYHCRKLSQLFSLQENRIYLRTTYLIPNTNYLIKTKMAVQVENAD